jgi:hypothetical protein
MPKDSELPDSGAPLPSHRRLAALNLEEPVVLDFAARAQDFLKRITPLSADLAARGRTRTLALQKLHRICLAEVRTLKARYTLATVKLALSKYRERDSRRGPRSLGLAPKENAFRSALQLSRAGSRRNPHAGAPPTTSASTSDQSNLIPLGSGGLHPNCSRTPGQRPLPPKRHRPG